MIRLEPLHRGREPVHFSTNASRTAEFSGQGDLHDIEESVNYPSSSSWAGPSHSRSIVGKPSKLSSSFVPSSSSQISVDIVEVNRDNSVTHSESGNEDEDDNPSAGRRKSISKGKGKAQADPIVHVDAGIDAPTRRCRSDRDGGTSREGANRNTSANSDDASENPRRMSALLRELRGQGFGFVIVILFANLAVVVSVFAFCGSRLLMKLRLALQVCLICRTSCT